MKILHVADTHIGYSAYRKVEAGTGLNLREVDILSAFEKFIDSAIDSHPDLVLHAGDLFDTVRPTNRSISAVMELLLRLSAAKIPIIIIAGNHEAPKLKETGSVFKLFEHIDGVYPIYKEEYEKVEIGNMMIHAVPHSDHMKEEIGKIKIDEESDYNVLMLHGGAETISAFEKSNEELFSLNEMGRFDYTALGHYHKPTKVRENTYYAGSTERLSFADAGEPRGYLEINFEKDTPVVVKFKPIKIREMKDLKPVKCEGLKDEEIITQIHDRITNCDPDDKIIRLKVEKIPFRVYTAVDFDSIKKMTAGSVHFQANWEIVRKDQPGVVRPNVRFKSIKEEFEKYLANYGLDEEETEKLTKMGIGYIDKVLEK